jgi:hypothetical protein
MFLLITNQLSGTANFSAEFGCFRASKSEKLLSFGKISLTPVQTSPSRNHIDNLGPNLRCCSRVEQIHRYLLIMLDHSIELNIKLDVKIMHLSLTYAEIQFQSRSLNSGLKLEKIN